MIKAINYHHVKDLSKLDGHTVYIGRANNKYGKHPESILHNPVKGENAVPLFRQHLWRHIRTGGKMRNEIIRLACIAKEYDLNLVCWCKPKPCHGDVVKAAIEWVIKEGLA